LLSQSCIWLGTSCRDGYPWGMVDKDAAEDDRLVIPLDPEEALKAFLKVDPKDLPADDGDDDPEDGDRQPRVGSR
jgi:hypothetical protein